jgi:hypothetical protein
VSIRQPGIAPPCLGGGGHESASVEPFSPMHFLAFVCLLTEHFLFSFLRQFTFFPDQVAFVWLSSRTTWLKA